MTSPTPTKLRQAADIVERYCAAKSDGRPDWLTAADGYLSARNLRAAADEAEADQ